LDAYQRVLQCNLDAVILATPPAFRPLHFEAAIRAGKHVFAERPLAVDAPGIHRLLAANRDARRRRLAVAVGLQGRHETAIQETIDRLHEGAIGDIHLLRCYDNRQAVRPPVVRPGDSDLEIQIRNWRYSPELGGGLLFEQQIPNLDLMNWIKAGEPIEAQGQASQTKTGKAAPGGEYQFVELTYVDGARLFSQSRRMAGCWNSVAAHVLGSRGRADVTGGKVYDARGRISWRSDAARGGHQRQQDRWFSALRSGDDLNEVCEGVQSTMTAILGRMACQLRRPVTWQEALRSEYPAGGAEGPGQWTQLLA
jgi:predicted dehydrogenase